jgi:D-alanyl-D-alanine carboxypeptidase (penicillin-binding protein 5/6)
VRRGVVAVLLAAAVAAPARAAAAAGPPAVTAPQAILVSPQTGDVLFRRDADAERPVASTTKLMTALLVLEKVPLDDVFTALPYKADPAESRVGLHPGERMAVRDLLQALLVESANDAAVALAAGTSGSVDAFVAEMNRRAQSLGLRHTHYANPVGLDQAGNYSSATDLAKLALVLRDNAFFRRTVALRRARLTTGARPRTIKSSNDLIGNYRIVDGIKTGHTPAAGYALVGSATRNGIEALSVVLREPSRDARDSDTLALLRYGLDQYRRTPVVSRDRVLGSARVRYRENDRIQLVPARTVERILRRGERTAVAVRAPRTLEGPLPEGAVVGSVTVRQRGRIVDRVPLVTAAPVPEVGIAVRALDFIFKPGTLAGLTLLAAGGAGIAVLLRRRRRAATEA